MKGYLAQNHQGNVKEDGGQSQQAWSRPAQCIRSLQITETSTEQKAKQEKSQQPDITSMCTPVTGDHMEDVPAGSGLGLR